MSEVPKESLFSFAILTDLHLAELNGLEKFHAGLEALSQEKDLAFIQIMGDLIYDGPLGGFKKIMEGADLPYHVVIGNHDAQRMREFQEAFGKPYYSFEHRNCLFVCLFNALPALDNVHAHHGDIDEEQALWVRDLLEQASKRRPEYQKIFLFAHVPPLQPGSPMSPSFRMTIESTDLVYDLCREHVIDACFYGHVHINEAFEYEGTWHITTPSTNWNFNTCFGYVHEDWIPADYGGYRIVHVMADEISDELRWTHRGFEPIQL